jgi:hypothetical protein
LAGPSNRKPVQRLKNGAHYPPEGLPRNDSKSPCGTGGFEAGFSGRGSGIQGPRHAIGIEIEQAHHWQEMVSASGVRSYVTTFRPRALREPAP